MPCKPPLPFSIKEEGQFAVLPFLTTASPPRETTREMPVWGENYTRELKYPGSTLSEDVIQTMVRLRVLALIEYISTLQGK